MTSAAQVQPTGGPREWAATELEEGAERTSLSWPGAWPGRVYAIPCVLPGGYVAPDGTVHRQVELAPLTGREEELLASASVDCAAATIITQLLARRLQRLGAITEITPAIVLDLSVSDRDYLVLKLWEATFGPQIEALLHCPASACGQPMEVTFPLAAFEPPENPASARWRRFQAAHDEMPREPIALEFEFRLPTGADQEALVELARFDPASAEDRLLARCVRPVGKENATEDALLCRPPAELRLALEQQMQVLAPPLMLELQGVCPACQQSYAMAFEGAPFFLAEMRGNLSRLEHDVHLLAWHYHWSESDILSLPTAKRHRYLWHLEQQMELNSPA